MGILKGTGKVTVFAIGKGLALTKWSAKSAWKHKGKIFGASLGAAKGLTGAIYDTSGHLISSDKLAQKTQKIQWQSQVYRNQVKVVRQRIQKGLQDKQTLMDSLLVGGSLLAELTNRHTPENIVRAYELAYPNLAENISFTERVSELDGNELVGFVSGVKGKLFEIKYVEYLNNGNLPAGYTASISPNPNNPDWDILVAGPNGGTSELIQAKATDSVSYVAEAIRENPHIDVVTTSEVYGQLVMQGYADSVIDGGITESALSGEIESAISDVTLAPDLMPPVVALALIAWSAYSEEGLSEYKKAKTFGERSAKTYLAYLVGGTAAAFSGTLWVGIISGVGTRFILSSGARKRGQLTDLNRLIKSNKKTIKRLQWATI